MPYHKLVLIKIHLIKKGIVHLNLVTGFVIAIH